jgi:radical SAM superfamily enzyme YgiQ (UPF0313 family)
LEYIAAYLEKNGVEVKIIDEIAGQNVEKEIKKFNPEVVGVTATTLTVRDAYRVLDLCRELGIRTVIGGVHATALPNEAIKHADIVVQGEGEIAMLDILKNNIKRGIIQGQPVQNLDDLPVPARHLIDMEFYMLMLNNAMMDYTSSNARPFGMMSSRGCPFQCIFCHNSCRKIPLRFHSAARVIFEIESLVDKYGANALYFWDDNVMSNKPRFRETCKLLIERKLNITWGCATRVDAIDLDTLKLAYEAGCRELNFGFESGSQRMLNLMNKKTTVEQNYKAIDLCIEAGIKVRGTVIIGFPTETEEEIRMTQEFIKKAGEKGVNIGVCWLTVFPATELWNMCEENGILKPIETIDWSKFNVMHSSDFSPCTNIPIKRLRELFEETNMLTFKQKRKYSLSWIIKVMITKQRIFMNIIKSADIKKYAKRIKLR